MTEHTLEHRASTPSSVEMQAAPEQEQPLQIIGRFVGSLNGDTQGAETDRTVNGPSDLDRAPVVVFCHEPPESYIGGHVAGVVRALAGRGTRVHLFSRHSFSFEEPRVRVQVVGATDEGDIVDQVQDFTRRAGNAFMQQFPPHRSASLLGCEWTAAPVLSLLRGLRNLQGVLSLHTLERQRSDMSSEMAGRIAAIEREGIEKARTLLIHDPATAEVVRSWAPECSDRMVQARTLFNIGSFETNVDPGAIKARYQVGPLDPVILCVGDLDERYGSDLLLKAMPPILRHHPQARLVIVGDGNLLWPLRVYARYLLLEHAVRLVGNVVDQPMYELMQAADVVAVPSRGSTPWWPILAGWAARRPVVASHEAAKGLLEHEKDSVLVYPSENSIVWGVERVLYDAELRKNIGAAGRQKLEARFGWNALAEQIEELLLSVGSR